MLPSSKWEWVIYIVSSIWMDDFSLDWEEEFILMREERVDSRLISELWLSLEYVCWLLRSIIGKSGGFDNYEWISGGNPLVTLSRQFPCTLDRLNGSNCTVYDIRGKSIDKRKDQLVEDAFKWATVHSFSISEKNELVKIRIFFQSYGRHCIVYSAWERIRYSRWGTYRSCDCLW